MEFPGFWGNEQLKANLSAAVDRRRTAHFYLISGPRGSGKRTLAGSWRRLFCAGTLTAVHAAVAASAGRF